MLIDVSLMNLIGKVVEKVFDDVGIIINKNIIFYDE